MNDRGASVQPGDPPGRIGYGVAGLVFAAAMAIFATVLHDRIGRLDGQFLRVTVPGEHRLALEAGAHTIFHEAGAGTTGRVSLAGIEGLEISITAPDGAAILLRPNRSSRYSLPGRKGESLFDFTVDAPGYHRFVARQGGVAAAANAAGGGAQFAIARGFMGALLGTIFTGLAIALGGAALAGAIAFVTWRRRRTAMAATGRN